MDLSQRALLVEDEPALRMLLCDILTEAGLTVDAFGDAESAWEHYQQHQALDFRLLLLDWMLPGKSGLELCEQIRARPDGEAAFIWLITSKDSPQDLLTLLEAGVNEYLSKPLDLDALTVRVQVALRQSAWVQQHYQAQQALEAHQTQLEAQVAARTRELSALSQRLIQVQEAQQQRISREIHDELGQIMTALKLDLSWLLRQVEADALKDRIQHMLPMVSDTITTIQRICAELRPGILDDLGLVAALEWVIDNFCERTGLTPHVDLPPDLELNNDLGLVLFRITQECLTNIMRYAQATQVWIRLHSEARELWLDIRDDGVGMDITRVMDNPRSIGILGMKERLIPFAGRLDIISQPHQGTHVRVYIKDILHKGDIYEPHSDR